MWPTVAGRQKTRAEVAATRFAKTVQNVLGKDIFDREKVKDYARVAHAMEGGIESTIQFAILVTFF